MTVNVNDWQSSTHDSVPPFSINKTAILRKLLLRKDFYLEIKN